jgi:glycosyltransferase XagB
VAFAAAPGATINVLATACSAAILAAGALRILCACRAGPAPTRRPRVADHELPVYTVICPLYREGAVVRQLVAAIRALGCWKSLM